MDKLKFSVTHYLNTRVKVKAGEKYPIYIRINYQQSTNSIKSLLLSHVLLTEKEFNEVFYIISKERELSKVLSMPPKLKYLEEVLYLMQSEIKLFAGLFKFYKERNLEFSVNRIIHYINIFTTSVKEALDYKQSSFVRDIIIESLSDKTGLAKILFEEMLIEKISLDNEVLTTKEITILGLGNHEILKIEYYKHCFSAFETQKKRTSIELAPFNIIDYFFRGIQEEFENFLNTEKVVSKNSMQVNLILDYHWEEIQELVETDTAFKHPIPSFSRILYFFIEDRVNLVNELLF